MDVTKTTADSYNKIASEYNAGHFVHFWVEEFEFFKNRVSGKKIIDLGCGAGRDAEVFVKNGFDYTGIDASSGMLEVASKRVPKGKFIQMDFLKTSFPNKTFDGFWAAASFLHIPKSDLPDVLQEAKRITKTGGIGFISVKEKTEMDEGLIEEKKYGGISRYFSFYTQNEFKDTIETNGFTIIKMITHMENDERNTNWLCYFVKKPV